MRPTCDVTEQLSTMISHSYGKTDLPDTYANGAVEGVLVAGVRVDAVDYAALSEIISKWIQTPSDRGRYVVQGNAQHVVEVKRVQTGANLDADVIVTSGIAEGDKVIVDGIQKVRPGQAVQETVLPAAPGR